MLFRNTLDSLFIKCRTSLIKKKKKLPKLPFSRMATHMWQGTSLKYLHINLSPWRNMLCKVICKVSSILIRKKGITNWSVYCIFKNNKHFLLSLHVYQNCLNQRTCVKGNNLLYKLHVNHTVSQYHIYSIFGKGNKITTY